MSETNKKVPTFAIPTGQDSARGLLCGMHTAELPDGNGSSVQVNLPCDPFAMCDKRATMMSFGGQLASEDLEKVRVCRNEMRKKFKQ
jgi:hypothetical protein